LLGLIRPRNGFAQKLPEAGSTLVFVQSPRGIAVPVL
jgi:hypothetical protein